MKFNKLFLTLVIALLFSSIFAQAFDPQAATIEIRHANIKVLHLTLSSFAQGMLDYITSIQGDTSQLAALKSSFDGDKDELLSINNDVQLNLKMQETATTLNAFVQEYDKQLKAKTGNPLLGLGKALESVKSKESEINSLTASYWNIRQTNTMQLFDYYYAQGDNFVSWYKKNGYDTTKLEGILTSINNKKPELQTALNAKNDAQVNGVMVSIGVLVQQLGTEADRLLKSPK